MSIHPFLSFLVWRASLIWTNIQDFLFTRSTKQRHPGCSFSKFWQYIVFHVILKCDADFFKASMAFTVQPATASQKPSDQSEYVFLIQVHSILLYCLVLKSSLNFRPRFQHLPSKPSIAFYLIKFIFFKGSPVTTVQSTTASRNFPDQSE